MGNDTNSSRKKILLISYHFPPSTAVGGLRTAKFAKYLPLFGWDVSVLTIKNSYLQEKDSERLQGLNNVKIIETALIPKISQLYVSLKKLFISGKAHKNKRITGAMITKSSPAPDNKQGEGDEEFSHRIKRYIASLFLALPDYEKNWILPATFHAVREIKRDKINCIITTSPPTSVNLIGLLVKLITGVKWVADFRDPWLGDTGKRLYPTCALSLRIERFLEKKVMKKADSILTTTEILRDKYLNQYSNLLQKKFLTICNGFDQAVFSGFPSVEKFQRFTLTYAGTFYLGRTPEPIFKAVENLIGQNKISPENICIKLIGNCDSIEGQPTSDLISSYGLNTIVEVLEPVPYSAALEIIRKSHIALLFAANQPMQIPAKLFDYIGAGTPVLAVAESGATADLVNTNKIGKAFNPNDTEGIATFIFESITNDASSLYDTDKAKKTFEIKSIVKHLNDHLDNLVYFS